MALADNGAALYPYAMKTLLLAGLLFVFAAPARADHSVFAAPACADHSSSGALRILDSGCRASAGVESNGFQCFRDGVRSLIEGRGRYSLISAMCNAARGTSHNGWECFKAATAMAIMLGDGGLQPIDSACRAAAGFDGSGYRCFQRAYADLASRERWKAAQDVPHAPAF